MRRIVLAGLFFLHAVGLASAQPGSEPQVTFTATPPDDLLTPGEVVEVPLAFTMTCPGLGALETFHVAFSIQEAPAYATTIMNPLSASVTFPPDRCATPGYVQTAETVAIVRTNRDAPAYTTFAVAIAATVSGPEGGYGPYVANFSITNDYVPLTVLNPSHFYQKAGQGVKVAFPVEIQNLGNGKTQYSFTAVPVNGSNVEALDVTPGFVLESQLQKGSGALFRRTFTVEMHTPTYGFYENRIEQVELTMSSKSAERNDSATESRTITLSVQVQGAAAPAPSMSVPVMALFIVIALAGIRRLRGPSGPR